MLTGARSVVPTRTPDAKKAPRRRFALRLKSSVVFPRSSDTGRYCSLIGTSTLECAPCLPSVAIILRAKTRSPCGIP